MEIRRWCNVNVGTFIGISFYLNLIFIRFQDYKYLTKKRKKRKKKRKRSINVIVGLYCRIPTTS